MNAGALTVEAMFNLLERRLCTVRVDVGERDDIYIYIYICRRHIWCPCVSPDVALTAISIGVEATKDAPWKNLDSHGRHTATEAGVDASRSTLPLICHVDPAGILFMLQLIICGEIEKDARIEPYAAHLCNKQ